MAPANDAEAQFKFLISCIKHSVAGKVDFQAVATELEIVSKAAAAKRYERLLKAHDASPRKAPDGSGEDMPAPKKAKTPRKRAAAKISKAEQVEDEDEDVKEEFKDDGSDMEKKPAKKKAAGKRTGSGGGADVHGSDPDPDPSSSTLRGFSPDLPTLPDSFPLLLGPDFFSLSP
ncbi:hypothetical protein QBC39DRAFT_433036 [Podospora conica]|nr:hypothetical protein QBC39DRAFT_433036 [Schizothecium conicum]